MSIKLILAVNSHQPTTGMEEVLITCKLITFLCASWPIFDVDSMRAHPLALVKIAINLLYHCTNSCLHLSAWFAVCGRLLVPSICASPSFLCLYVCLYLSLTNVSASLSSLSFRLANTCSTFQTTYTCFAVQVCRLSLLCVCWLMPAVQNETFAYKLENVTHNKKCFLSQFLT